MDRILFIRKNRTRILKWISCIVLTGVLSARTDAWGTIQMRLLGVIWSAVIWGYCIFRIQLFTDDGIEQCGYKEILTGILSASWLYVSISFWRSAYQEQLDYIVLKYNIHNAAFFLNMVSITLFVVSFAGAYCVIKHIYEVVLHAVGCFVQSMDSVEKGYLKIWTGLSCVFLPVIYNLTVVFYNSGRNNVLYTYDSNDIYIQNVYMIMGQHENDIRQSLFALFSMPVSILAYVASRIISFPHAYAVFMQFVQNILAAATFILVSRIMKVYGKKKAVFFLFISASYSMLLFSLVMEQYIILTFWLVVSIYCIVEKTGDRERCAVGAAGTLPTNSLLLFWEYKNCRSIKIFMEFVLRSVGKFAACIICFGQAGLILDSIKNVIRLTESSMRNVGFVEKVYQFIYFIRCCFAAPAVCVRFENDTYSLAMDAVTDIDLLGLALVIFLILGSIQLRNLEAVRICTVWNLFSVFLLVVIGWCAADNDMILFIYYFGWSFFVVIYLEFMHLMKNIKISWLLFLGTIVCMAYFNIVEIARIVDFGITYYPFS